MKALVIGGNRFFGKRLVTRLLARGADVTVLNRGQLADDFGERVHRIRMDRRELSKTSPGLADQTWDVVYDQVCYDATEARQACETFEGRTRNYVFISSQSVYGPGAALSEAAFDPRTHAFEEEAARDVDYAEAKRQAESTFYRHADFPVTAVRFPIVLGPDDYTKRLELHVERIAREEPLYFPAVDARISFVEVGDAAAFLESLAERAVGEPINCCSPRPIVLSRVLDLIEQATGKHARLSDSAEGATPSPFGIDGDWFMATERLARFGFSPREIEAWLPPLIAGFARSVRFS